MEKMENEDGAGGPAEVLHSINRLVELEKRITSLEQNSFGKKIRKSTMMNKNSNKKAGTFRNNTNQSRDGDAGVIQFSTSHKLATLNEPSRTVYNASINPTVLQNQNGFHDEDASVLTEDSGQVR